MGKVIHQIMIKCQKSVIIGANIQHFEKSVHLHGLQWCIFLISKLPHSHSECCIMG